MLQIVEAKRHLFPVTKLNKKGEEKTSWVPGSYGITLSDGHYVCVVNRTVKIGDEFGKEKFVSVKAPKTPTHDTLGRIIGEEEKRKMTFPSSSWKTFVEEYQRCGMPELILQGMIQADAELAAKRAAARG